jgi:hypothetical protein
VGVYLDVFRFDSSSKLQNITKSSSRSSPSM